MQDLIERLSQEGTYTLRFQTDFVSYRLQVENAKEYTGILTLEARNSDELCIRVKIPILEYNWGKMESQPSQYLQEQCTAHKDYLKVLEGIADICQISYNHRVEQEMRLERTRKFVSEGLLRVILNLFKWCATPFSVAFKRKTFHKVLLENIEESKIMAYKYDLLRITLEHGRDFFDTCKEEFNNKLSEEEKKSLDQLAGLASNIAQQYSLLKHCANNETEMERRNYFLFYPPKQLK